jgi:hypothetical protein
MSTEKEFIPDSNGIIEIQVNELYVDIDPKTELIALNHHGQHRTIILHYDEALQLANHLRNFFKKYDKT